MHLKLIIILCLYLSGTLFTAAAYQFPEIERGVYAKADVKKPWMIVHAVACGFDSVITSAKYLPDGERVLVSGDYGELSLVDINSGNIIWMRPPYPQSNNPLFVLDVSPDGKTFVTKTGIGAREDHTALNLHRVTDGKVIRQIEEDSTFYQSNLAIDHRKPSIQEIQEREEMELGPNWRLVPFSARYIQQGKQLITQFQNLMSGPNLYDRVFILFDTQNYTKIWQWQIVSDYDKISQPAGFVISLPPPVIAGLPDGSSYLYGNAHAELRLLDKKIIAQGQSQVDVYRKKEGLLWSRIAALDNGMSEFGMGVKDMQLTPDGLHLFVAAGETGYTQIIIYNLKTRKEVLRSNVFDARALCLSPDQEILLVSAANNTAANYIIDIKVGKIGYIGPRFGGTTGLVDLNKQSREICLAGKGQIFFLRERPVTKITLGNHWQKTGLYLTQAAACHIYGMGKVELSTLAVPEEERWSIDDTDELFFGPGDGRDSLAEAAYEGELFLKSEDGGEWLIYGGLTQAEFRSVEQLRKKLPWN